jgi:hypothetical protein
MKLLNVCKEAVVTLLKILPRNSPEANRSLKKVTADYGLIGVRTGYLQCTNLEHYYYTDSSIRTK